MRPTVDASTLRLALFTDTWLPQVNGVSRTLARLVDAVHERGGAVRVFTLHDPAAKETDDANVVRYPSIAFWAYEGLRLGLPRQRTVNDDVAEFAPTLVHAATEFGTGLAGRRAAHRLGVPFVSSYHTNFTSYAKFYRLGLLAKPGWAYLRWFHNGGLRTYCPTTAIRDEIDAQGFINSAVWSRGIDTDRFSPRFRSPACRERMGAGDDTLVVTYIGRLAAEKGLDVALEALRIVDAQRPGRMRFAAVGDGPYADAVHRNAPAESWLPGVLHGDALSEVYASGDVFLFPSTTDTFGNVLLEAMASGLPVVGADVGPTRELVAPDRGWLAEPGNAAALAGVIIDLVDNREKLAAARQRALAFAVSKTWQRVWDALIGDYVALHAGPPSPARPPSSPSALATG